MVIVNNTFLQLLVTPVKKKLYIPGQIHQVQSNRLTLVLVSTVEENIMGIWGHCQIFYFLTIISVVILN